MNSVPYRLFADLLILIHLGFVIFVLFGALVVARWPCLAWVHLPAVAWGVLVEMTGWICPLTPWEQQLRAAAGTGTYEGGFVDHYLLPALYPSGLTRDTQVALGVVVLVVNLAAYAWLVSRRVRRGTGRH